MRDTIGLVVRIDTATACAIGLAASGIASGAEETAGTSEEANVVCNKPMA